MYVGGRILGRDEVGLKDGVGFVGCLFHALLRFDLILNELGLFGDLDFGVFGDLKSPRNGISFNCRRSVLFIVPSNHLLYGLIFRIGNTKIVLMAFDYLEFCDMEWMGTSVVALDDMDFDYVMNLGVGV